jgi:hypothetical protein
MAKNSIANIFIYIIFMANKLIQLKDNLGNLLFPKTQKNIMTAYRDRSWYGLTSGWQIYNIGLSGASGASIGSKLTFTTSGIKIGAGVSKVLVSLLCTLNHANIGGDKTVCILKNGANAGYSTYEGNANNWRTSVINSSIVNVTQNDLISIGVSSGIGGSMEFLGCYITVEVVE